MPNDENDAGAASGTVTEVARLYTVEEVAAITKMPKQTIYATIHSGLLKALNLAPGGGQVLRIAEPDLAAFLESRRYVYQPNARRERPTAGGSTGGRRNDG